MLKDTNSIEPTNTDQLLAEISQYWANYNGSVLWNLMDAYNAPMTKISKSAKQIEEWREIKNAQGTGLDMIGQDFKAYRTSDDDDIYRFLIYIKFLLSHAQGTTSSIMQISETSLQRKDNFKIIQTKPRHIVIKIPFSQITNLKFEKLVLNNLKQLVAMGIWLDKIAFDSQTNSIDYFGADTVYQEHVHLVAE